MLVFSLPWVISVFRGLIFLHGICRTHQDLGPVGKLKTVVSGYSGGPAYDTMISFFTGNNALIANS